jgi:diguanylate cyclase (GGDEF)-like protein
VLNFPGLSLSQRRLRGVPLGPGRPRDPLRGFALKILLPAATVYLGVCLLVLTALHLMAEDMNGIDDQHARRAVAAAMDSLVGQLGDSVADEATWTEAFVNTNVDFNPAWLDATWGATARISDNYDTAIVTDIHGNIVFGETVHGAVTGNIADHFSSVPALIAELDSGIANIGDDAVVDGLSRSGAGVAAIAGSVIHGNTGQASVPHDERRILWLARGLDSQLLRATATRYDLPLPRLADPAPGDATVTLTDASGANIGALSWPPRRPGDPAFRHTAGIASLIMGVIGGLVVAVLAAFRHAVAVRAASEARDWKSARWDSVTGFVNRFGFEESLRNALPPRRGEVPLSVAVIGVDRFIEVTGSYGHRTGELMLASLARMLEARIDSRALIARTGPTEFAIACHGDAAGGAIRELGQGLLGIADEGLRVDELTLKIGLSLGVADTLATRETVGESLRLAEIALAQARETGGNHLVDYDPAIEEERRRRLALEADIRRGLAAGEFDLAYQPVIDFGSRSIVAAEALMRWPRRPGGALPPDEFIPAAEASGLIEDLGMFALRRAVAELGGFEGLKISVNVSTAQFRSPVLAETVLDIVAEAGLSPDRLQLEITETLLLTQPERARRIIGRLRARGVVVALDDFGTGYSSVGYLRQFEFDRVKLDRSLVAGITQGSVQQALVESTMLYAAARGLAVTAEGVERPEEAAALARLGCREFQGFLFGRPMPLAALERLLAVEAVRQAG